MNTIQDVNLKLELAYVRAKYEADQKQGEQIRRLQKIAKLWDCSVDEAKATIKRIASVIAYCDAIKREDSE